jgi:dUTPase
MFESKTKKRLTEIRNIVKSQREDIDKLIANITTIKGELLTIKRFKRFAKATIEVPLFIDKGALAPLLKNDHSPVAMAFAYIPNDNGELKIEPHARKVVSLGIRFAMPNHTKVMINYLKNTFLDKGLFVLPTTVVGKQMANIEVIVWNTTDKEVILKDKDAITTLLFSYTDETKVYPTFIENRVENE